MGQLGVMTITGSQWLGHQNIESKQQSCRLLVDRDLLNDNLVDTMLLKTIAKTSN